MSVSCVWYLMLSSRTGMQPFREPVLLPEVVLAACSTALLSRIHLGNGDEPLDINKGGNDY